MSIRCTRAVADLHARADAASERISQCLFGERVEVLDGARTALRDWSRVRLLRDGYTGYIEARALEPIAADALPVIMVGVRATLVFAAPDLKGPVLARLPFGAAIDPREDLPPSGADGAFDRASGARFVRVAHRDGNDGHVRADHLRAIGTPLAGSAVDVARRLYDGAPYLWGGRTPDGADCSGLVQGAASALGLTLPRDSGDQERFLTRRIEARDRRGSDLAFWPGHVALLVDPETIFHATAHTLATCVEPLADIVARAGEPSSFRRLPLPS